MPLGRTNQDFAPFWLAPRLPETPSQLASLAAAIRQSDQPIDVSSGPAYWGSVLRDRPNPVLVRLGRKLERATDANHATDLVQAEVIERLSSLGRVQVDIVGWVIERPLEEFQIDGALRALELARQEGHLKHLALVAKGPALTVQSVWQFHDAFELLIAPVGPELDALAGMARARRVGVVAELPAVDWSYHQGTALLPVTCAEEMLVGGPR